MTNWTDRVGRDDLETKDLSATALVQVREYVANLEVREMCQALCAGEKLGGNTRALQDAIKQLVNDAVSIKTLSEVCGSEKPMTPLTLQSLRDNLSVLKRHNNTPLWHAFEEAARNSNRLDVHMHGVEWRRQLQAMDFSPILDAAYAKAEASMRQTYAGLETKLPTPG